MDSVFSVKALLSPDCYMASIDLRDAYLFVPITEGSKKCLRLAVRTREKTVHLQFRAHPCGLSSSPCIFTKVMVETLPFLRLRGISVIAYLDDLLLFSPSPEQLVQDLQVERSLLENLGWLLNLETSNLVSSQRVTVLGYILDSTQWKVFLPQEKIQKVDKAILLQSPGLDKTGNVSPRLTDGCPPCRAEGRPTLSPVAVFHPRGMGPEVLGLASTSTKTGKEVSVVVELDGKRVSWAGVGSASFQDRHDRCKRHWLGCAPRSAAGAGFLESRGLEEVLELEGVEGNCTCP